MENLLNCDGRKFKAKIEGIECEGFITVEYDDVYLCQDNIDGEHDIDKKGFKYSWCVYSGTERDLIDNDVTGFEIIKEQYPIVKKQRYTYKGKIYVIFEQTKMKINGVWEDCVIYQTLYDNPDGEFWVRSSKEFYSLFKEVK